MGNTDLRSSVHFGFERTGISDSRILSTNHKSFHIQRVKLLHLMLAYSKFDTSLGPSVLIYRREANTDCSDEYFHN